MPRQYCSIVRVDSDSIGQAVGTSETTESQVAWVQFPNNGNWTSNEGMCIKLAHYDACVSLCLDIQTMQSSMAMAQAMGQTAKTMGAMNQAVRPQDIQKTMMEFEKQSTHMSMAEEMSWSIVASVILCYYLSSQ